MIKWSEILKKWIFIFTAPNIAVSLICENYKEAWFFRTYEDDMDYGFVQDYLTNS